ncbi:unnamed protein product, partial [Symbiodinium microadriaticum]
MVRPRGEPPGAPPPRLRGSDSLLLLVAVVVSTSVSTPSSVLRRTGGRCGARCACKLQLSGERATPGYSLPASLRL